nr:PREDICTED: protein BTG1 [Equus przewalskii]
MPSHSSQFSGRHSGFICLQADYVSSSLSSRPLAPPPGPFSRPLRLRICLRHNGAISGLAGVGRHAPATPLPFRGAIKSAARRLLLFARRSWKCRCWGFRRLRRWRRRRLGKSERCVVSKPLPALSPPRTRTAAPAVRGFFKSWGVFIFTLARSQRRKETAAGAHSKDLSIVSLFFSSIEHYKHHWFPEKPCKGSGYRCIRINHKMDPLIGQAAQRIGLSSQELFRLLPSELTLWVDPYEVSYRIGEDGSICVLYEASPAGGSTQNSTNVQMVDSRISCKEELLLGRTSPSKNYNMMTVSG